MSVANLWRSHGSLTSFGTFLIVFHSTTLSFDRFYQVNREDLNYYKKGSEFSNHLGIALRKYSELVFSLLL